MKKIVGSVVALATMLVLFVDKTDGRNNFYKVKWDRMVIYNLDYDIVNVTGGCTFINRSTKALNLVFDLKYKISETNVVKLLAHKLINNQWVKYSSIQFVETLKSILKMQWFDLQSLFKKYANPPLVWPWQQTVYTIKDFTFNSDAFPPYIPLGSYKGESTFHETRKMDTTWLQMDWYISLVPLSSIKKESTNPEN